MTFEFVQRAPAETLKGLIESLWFARGSIPYQRELIAPTGSTVLVCILGPPMVVTADANDGPIEFIDGYVLGPHDRPVLNEPTAHTVAAGIVTTAVGARAALGIDPAPLRGAACSFPTAGGWALEVGDAARSATEAQAVLDAMESVVLDRVGPTGVSVTLASRAVDLLANDPARSVASVAGELGVTPGQLHRVMTQVVGLSPVAMRRIMRMRRLLEVADDPGVGGWTGLAARFGWYDQSHFTRDFRRHTGVTPGEYRRARIAHLQVEDRTPGFVPRP